MNNAQKQFAHIEARLRTELAGVKLLALGQTVFWDEPMKAVLRHVLDEHLPDATMVIGIHDADYFSKAPPNMSLAQDWTILPHNDGSTRDLWVATGEVSRLFGSETMPARELLVEHGVQIDKVGKDYPGGRSCFVDTVTEAWGWRGLVHVDSGNEVACCVPLRDALPHILELLSWGFQGTLESLSDVDSHRGERVADELLDEVRDYAGTHPDASVADMFRDILPTFYERLLGYEPRNLELTTSLELFKFNRSTAQLPRFRPMAAFLDPATREVCRKAYDRAVEGLDIYTLDRFPEGAIPFDIVIPGTGRGTVCLREGEIVIDTDDPIRIPCRACPVDVDEFASVLQDHLGRDFALIGKAVTLVLMMASEYVFVLNMEGSSYVPRCEQMVASMKEQGVDLPFYPILRIGYHTWDALRDTDVTFSLPGHLAASFGQSDITAMEFADTWRAVTIGQERMLEQIKGLSSREELLAFLSEHDPEAWTERRAEYVSATETIRNLSEQIAPMKAESVRLRDLGYQLRQEVQQLEVQKGEHFRGNIRPIREEIQRLEENGAPAEETQASAERIGAHEAERSELERRISDIQSEARTAQHRSQDLKKTVQGMEKSPETLQARERLKAIEYEAELARAWLVRDAILTSKGLRYAGHRPPAWWFMLVDPQLDWFRRVIETTEFEFEEIEREP